ncbi:MAG: S41 family peptidase [Thiomargarita sp.]|nr:S41 family peptidase [Thiomargarita sp.]
MQNLSRHLPSLLIGIVIGSYIAIGGDVFADRQSDLSTIPVEELRTFTEVFHRIKTDYVEEVDDKTLLENAIHGMLNGLDPHSNYLTPEAYQEIKIGTTGKFGGLGIEVGMEDGFIKVIAPIDDTPAQRAGIKAGDLIIRLDDTPVKGMTLGDAVKIMRGKPGTGIILTIVRDTESKPITITVVRAIIRVKSIKSRMLEDNYGYIRISHFQSRTGSDLKKAIKALEKENKRKLEGVVLDLRNNPGGVLNAAVDVSDTFLNDGLIVYTKGRVEDASLNFKANNKDLLNGAPIVVLVNDGSASASEIVAGALQDHKRAIIMGTKTFGKGSVQTILPMNNNAALKLTTARYFTPLGRSIQAEGIKPDIILNKVEIASDGEESSSLRIKEADLAGHLDNGNSKKESEKKTDSQKKTTIQLNQTTDETDEPLIKKDYAIYEALNLLKGMNIMKMHRP